LELTSDEQLCELRVQDYVPSTSCGDYMVKVAKFIDEMLEKYYQLPPFYNAKDRQDLIGHMVIGLAPHTSGGVLCRLLGFRPDQRRLRTSVLPRRQTPQC